MEITIINSECAPQKEVEERNKKEKQRKTTNSSDHKNEP
jgi:hypothetical protein